MQLARLACVAIALCLLGTTLGACSDDGASEVDGPTPTEPVVYDAAPETTHDFGITKWGFLPDDDTTQSGTTFRGYNRHNKLLVEIRQTLEERDLFTKTFTLEMHGSLASGFERLEYVAEWDAEHKGMDYVKNVIENTFVEGSVAQRVLARLEPDATAMVRTTAAKEGAPSALTGSSRPLDANQPPQSLVGGKPGELLQCTCQRLSRESAAMSSKPGSMCPLVTPSRDPLTTTKALGLGVGVHAGGEIGPRAIVLDASGQPVVSSPWKGPYNIADNQCHHAAAANASATDGYIACNSQSSSTESAGHTVNWGPNPAQPGGFCGYEPQLDGSRPCCWQGGKGSDGSPLLNSDAAQQCVNKLCAGQASWPGWKNVWLATPPKAFPPGSKPAVPNDCASSTQDKGACNTCCSDQGDRIYSMFGTWFRSLIEDGVPESRKQIEDFRKRCAVSCLNADIKRNPPENRCLSALQDSKQSLQGTGAMCSKTPSTKN